ncbi:MAG: cyclase [Hyphomicrobiales bacterium]|nr:cyclase [Hyphomicrobiales bacterium]
MTTMFAKHHVSHYDSWRKVYDALDPVRKAHGVVRQRVYRSVDDPNEVTVMHRFETAKGAFEFAESKELKAAMAKGGVVGKPTIWFTERM